MARTGSLPAIAGWFLADATHSRYSTKRGKQPGALWGDSRDQCVSHGSPHPFIRPGDSRGIPDTNAFLTALRTHSFALARSAQKRDYGNALLGKKWVS